MEGIDNPPPPVAVFSPLSMRLYEGSAKGEKSGVRHPIRATPCAYVPGAALHSKTEIPPAELLTAAPRLFPDLVGNAFHGPVTREGLPRAALVGPHYVALPLSRGAALLGAASLFARLLELHLRSTMRARHEPAQWSE
jgi:hypothetical protein